MNRGEVKVKVRLKDSNCDASGEKATKDQRLIADQKNRFGGDDGGGYGG